MDTEVKAVRLRHIEEAIKNDIASITDLYREVVRDRLYEAAGFASAPEWAQQRIGGKWVALFPAEARKEIHAGMRSEGKSSRAIAEVTGMSHKTVQRDVSGSDVPDRVIAADGRSFPATRPAPKLDTGTPDRRPSGRNWGAAANTQIHRVLQSLASFVTGVESLIDGVTADADATEAELQTIDEAIKALRQLRRKLTQTA